MRIGKAGTYGMRLLAAIGAAALVYWTYAAVMPEPGDRLPASHVAGDEAGFDPLRSVALQTGAPISSYDRLVLLENGDEIFPAMLDAVREAAHSVDLLTYVYWQGEIAQQFAAALADAAARGVRVRVILDAWGAKEMDDALVRRIEAAGVDVAWFHPFRWYTLRRLNYRTHRKVLVVDDTIGFTGGVGIADEWTGNAGDPEHWRDDHFLVQGEVVRWLAGSFAENWRQATGELITPGAAAWRADTAAADSTGARRVVPISTSPRGDVSEIGLLYWTLLERATTNVNIATPYFVPDPAISEAIGKAARRGVRVRLLVPGPHNDSWIVGTASYDRFPDLLDAGVEVYLYQPTMMHVKSVTADGRWSIIGSPNFDNRSFELNDEIALLVDDPAFTRILDDSYERDLRSAERLTREAMRRAPFWRRWAADIAMLLREQL